MYNYSTQKLLFYRFIDFISKNGQFFCKKFGGYIINMYLCRQKYKWKV